MHCELVVPDLFGAEAPARYPALELLLARGRRTVETPQPQRLERWLHDAFSLEGDRVPAGALSLISANRDPGSDFWLRADPVHLRVMRDHAVVVPAEALTISRDEADAFCSALNSHFAGVLQVHVLDAGRWTARLFDNSLELDDVPALEIAGRQIPLERARDRQLTEIQMLLHAHPANAAREARGEPAINSLWLWGGGRAGKASSRWTSVLGNDPLIMGLTLLARARYRSVPMDGAKWLQGAPDEGRHLVLLDTLRVAARLGEADRYRDELARLERDWFAPLLRALRGGRIGMVTLHVPNAAQALSFETIRGDLRRFWRFARRIESYA